MGEGITYELDGDEVIEVRSSPALEAADEVEKLKAAGNAFVGKQEWDLALQQYQRALEVAEARGSVLTGDWEAERRAEKCVLACFANQALCALKLEKYDRCKEVCTNALTKHALLKQPNPSGKAKVLFRRGQACLGLGDSRVAVDSIAEAIELEEQQLGAKNRDSLVKSNEKEEKARMASILAMKRELQKARKALKEEEKTATKKFSGAKGFLKAKAKGFTDSKADRAEEIERRINQALEACFAPTTEDGHAFFERTLQALNKVRVAANSARDPVNELNATFGEGFVGFVAGETASGADSRQLFGKRTMECWESYWYSRQYLEHDGQFSLEDLEPPLKLTDAVARECAAHSFMRLSQLSKARPHFEKYIKLAREAGTLQAYHNLPDSFLLQRGMTKMDDKQRRAFRWKHRTHSPRALFDALTALAAIGQHANLKEVALAHARASLEEATEDEERAIAHKNLHLLLSAAWRDDSKCPVDEDDADASAAEGRIVAKQEHTIDPTPEELKLSLEHQKLALEFEAAVAKAAEEEAAKMTSGKNKLPDDEPAEEVAEEPGCETVDHDATEQPASD